MNDFMSYLPDVLINGRPLARAMINGGPAAPDLEGETLFYPFKDGAIVLSVVCGLPSDGPHGYHLHSGSECGSGAGSDPFAASGTHFNPANTTHPNHAGDMPSLFGMNGFAYSIFFTNRFKPPDVIGRTIVIHKEADDMRTQPSGNSGMKIACGEIRGI